MMDAKSSLYQSIRKGNARFYQSVNCPIEEYPWGILASSGINTPLLNGVVLVENGNEAVHAVYEVAASFQKRNLSYSWWIERNRFTPSLRASLEKNGMQSAGVFPGMGLDLTKFSRDCDSMAVEDVTSLEEWMQVIAKVFQFNEEVSKGYAQLLENANPDLYSHMAMKNDGKIVSTGSVLCFEDCAYIYNVSTSQEMRKQGYASSVMVKLLQKAKDKGAQSAALVSSPMAVPLYQQIGFSTFTDFEIYF